MKIILASASPRRLEILQQIGLNPRIIKPNIPEKRNPGEKVYDYLRRVTRRKGKSIYKREYFDSVLISADTIVLLNNIIIGKPQNKQDAKRILRMLSGKKHEVRTGIYLLYRNDEFFKVARTKVYFEKLSDNDIEYYLKVEQYKDKAGAYAIQGFASLFIKKIEGCYFNVVGFPLNMFHEMLKKTGLHLF